MVSSLVSEQIGGKYSDLLSLRQRIGLKKATRIFLSAYPATEGAEISVILFRFENIAYLCRTLPTKQVLP